MIVEKHGSKKPDTFKEDMAAYILKNMQLHIQDIHIRYEDNVTKPDRPFSFGITLKSLKLQVTLSSKTKH